MNNHLDMLGNPVTPGDLIIYPTASGSSSASMVYADVVSIDDIIKLPNGTWTLHSYRNKRSPTSYHPVGHYRQNDPNNWRDRTFVPDMDRAYVLRVYKIDSGYYSHSKPKLALIKNIDRITVVTNVVSGEIAANLSERREKRTAALEGRLVNV